MTARSKLACKVFLVRYTKAALEVVYGFFNISPGFIGIRLLPGTTFHAVIGSEIVCRAWH